MNPLTFECDCCGAVTPAVPALGLSSLNRRSVCPKCASKQLLYDAALDSLQEIQDRLTREWVAYWTAAGVKRESLLDSDPHLHSCEAIERTIEAIRKEVGA